MHGDWRVSTRLYGSRAPRRRSAPLGDRRRGVGACATPTATAPSPSSRPALVARARPRAARRLHDVLRPRCLHRAARARAGRAARRSSSACSSATRTSTGSPRRGGSSRAAGAGGASCTSSATARWSTVAESSCASGARWDRRLEPAEVARGARRVARARAPVGVGGPAARRGRGVPAAAAPSSARAPAGSPTSSRTASTACSSRPATPTRSPTRSCASLTDRELARAARRGRAAAASRAGSRRPRSTPTNVRAVVDAGRAREATRVLIVARDALRAAAPAGPASGSSRRSATRFDLRVLATAADGRAARRRRLPPRPAPAARRPRSSGRSCRCASRRLAREHRPEVIVAQSPYEAALVGGARRRELIVEVHGDWRTFTRLYGSPLRRAALAARRRASRAPASAAPTPCGRSRATRPASCASWASSRTPSSRPSSTSTPSSTRPPAPLPERPAALFVGVLELYKNVDGLARVWRRVAPRVPEARLGSSAAARSARWSRRSSRDLPEQVDGSSGSSRTRSRRALDARDVPRPAVALRGARPRAARGVPARPAGRGDGRRRDPRRGRGRRQRPARPDRRGELEEALVRRAHRPRARRAARRRRAGERRALVTTPEEYAERLAELVAATTSRPICRRGQGGVSGTPSSSRRRRRQRPADALPSPPRVSALRSGRARRWAVPVGIGSALLVVGLVVYLIRPIGLIHAPLLPTVTP